MARERLEIPEPIKFYIAGSFTEKERIKEYNQRIQELGATLSADWTTHPPIYPYDQNTERASEFAEEDLDGAIKCDVFVILPEKDGGSTQFAELGAAIYSPNVKRIFVVGENNSRSLSFFHPRVERVENFDAVLKAAGLVPDVK